jgi:PDZ domain-containing protein
MPDAGRRRVVTLVVATLLAVGLGFTALVLPVPYVELSPGLTCDTLSTCRNQQVIEIDKSVRQYPTKGQLRLTTVGVYGAPGTRITLWTALRGWLDDEVAVLPRDITFPPGQSAAENDCENIIEQEASQNSATTAALRQLKYTVPVTKEVYAANVGAGTAAASSGLKTCDVITSVNGREPTSKEDLVRLIQQHKPGDVVSLGYVRTNNKGKETRGTLRARLGADPDDPSRALLGVRPGDTELSHPPFKVDIKLQDVGGPSAGLMFALGIVDKLTPGDLTGGAVVAGTGTINDEGAVGPIGGVQQKVFAAKRDGASVFLSPSQDCPDAVRAHVRGVRLISVDTLAQTLSALAALRGEPGTVKDCRG